MEIDMDMTRVADWFADTSTNQAQCLVYSDGVILGLAVGEATHRTFLEYVGVVRIPPPQWGRSSDGFCHAYVFRGDPDELEPRLSTVVGVMGLDDDATISDNRHRDADTIDSIYLLLRRARG